MVDNHFIDHIMPHVTGTEWKVVCSVLRKTVGWRSEEGGRREWAQISVDEFQKMTGHERQAVIAAVREMLLRTSIERRTQQMGKQRTFLFRAVPKADLKEASKPKRRRQQPALPFDILSITEFENQTPMTPFEPVENLGQEETEFENQTASQSLKIKLRSGVSEFENQTSIGVSPNNVFKERSIPTKRSLTKENKNAVEKADRDSQTVEKSENQNPMNLVELCRFCQKQHDDPIRSPAVTIYRQRFSGMLPNEGFRHDIWVTVRDLLLWDKILEGWWYTNALGKRVEKNPLGIKQMLSAYEEAIRQRKEA